MEISRKPVFLTKYYNYVFYKTIEACDFLLFKFITHCVLTAQTVMSLKLIHTNIHGLPNF